MPTIEQEYVETHAQSRARHERAVRSMPNGVAHDGRVLSPFPFYVERADGARKWDVDGHAYLDCWSGHGALILGHNHPAITAAITEQARRGLHYSACHELEVRWAELIRACVPGAEKVRFTMNGHRDHGARRAGRPRRDGTVQDREVRGPLPRRPRRARRRGEGPVRDPDVGGRPQGDP